MKKCILLFLSCFVATLLVSTAAHAKTLTADKLQLFCEEVQKGAIGHPFNQQHAEHCTGYMEGFYDSLIILDKLTGIKQICIPPSLPRYGNTQILDAWIEKNEGIAKNTTAAVALFSALKLAFPCE